ncbi:hypothetical protein BSL78_11898 [Apostichopus japonicus]|uniref:Uncharacterized protein n=1 Tax=Stichopus japonicus TaxID=307972 RepID=A0A2G8KTA5_STIJA|nr:hypothetical protein BSL78_11898 [Apostichopus japonicus]
MCDMCNGNILDCSNQSLEQVTVNGGYSIIGLNLSHNSLSRTPNISGCMLIEWIDLSHNNIKFLTADNIERLSSHTLKVIDLSYNILLNMKTQNLGNFLPNLSIFNLSNNLLKTSSFVVADWKSLHHLKLLDLQNNTGDASNKLSTCDLGKECGIILLNSLNCSLYCIEAFLQIHCEFDYLFVECLVGDTSERSCSREDVNRPMLECDRSVSTTNASPMTASTEHMPSTVTLQVLYFSLAGTFLMLFLLIFTVWKCYRRSQRSNRYDKWLSVYTPHGHTVYPSLTKIVLDSSDFTVRKPHATLTKPSERRSGLASRAKSHEILSQHSKKNNRIMIRKQITSLPVPEREDPTPKRILSWI